MTAPALAKGPLASANNLTGITAVNLPTLTANNAVTWTHSFNAQPVAILLFDQTNRAIVPTGTGANQIAVTSNANAIVCTPGSTAIQATAYIIWAVPSQFANGIQASNFA